MRMSDFADSFFSMILDIQQDQSDLIAPEIYAINYYGLSISESSGATKISQAAKVPEDVINWTKRWNIEEEDMVHGPMRVVYSERKQMLDNFLAFWLTL